MKQRVAIKPSTGNGTYSSNLRDMTGEADFIQWKAGIACFQGARMALKAVQVAGRSFQLVALDDPAALLDVPRFAKRFNDEDRAPYGLELWPASIMLAEHVLGDCPGAGRPAIELGCGLGLVSLAAASHGWRIKATDYDPDSLKFARHNASLNRIKLAAIEQLDWREDTGGGKFERVYAADVLYQRVDHIPLIRCISDLLLPTGLGLIADPNRSIADEFAVPAREAGLAVEQVTTSAAVASGNTVQGRIFLLQRNDP